MKTSIFRSTCLLILAMASFVSCTNSDDDQSNPSNPDPQVISQGGDWKVTWYWDKDKDETNDFASYTFKFNADGSFESVGSGTTTGTWKVTDDNSAQRLVISAGSATKPLSDLDDDWIIVSMTDSKIELKDDNTEHLEELHFEKQ
ncbi:MAG: hypothetical protein IPM82_27910 [Saprospiraceae bacterium]|nr:hypothetical protein [Saprospiraceae bacterium]